MLWNVLLVVRRGMRSSAWQVGKSCIWMFEMTSERMMRRVLWICICVCVTFGVTRFLLDCFLFLQGDCLTCNSGSPTKRLLRVSVRRIVELELWPLTKGAQASLPTMVAQAVLHREILHVHGLLDLILPLESFIPVWLLHQLLSWIRPPPPSSGATSWSGRSYSSSDTCRPYTTHELMTTFGLKRNASPRGGVCVVCVCVCVCVTFRVTRFLGVCLTCNSGSPTKRLL